MFMFDEYTNEIYIATGIVPYNVLHIVCGCVWLCNTFYSVSVSLGESDLGAFLFNVRAHNGVIA